MGIFQRKPTCCEVCRIYFEPEEDESQARWDHLCRTHRAPVMARDLLHDAVMVWAEEHWEDLVPQFKEHTASLPPEEMDRSSGDEGQARKTIHIYPNTKLLT